MKCARCQNELDPDSRFCKRCGVTIQAFSRRITVSPPAVAFKGNSAAAVRTAAQPTVQPPNPNALPIPPQSTVPPSAAAKDESEPTESAPTEADALTVGPTGETAERLLWQARPAVQSFYPLWALWTMVCLLAGYQIFTRTESGSLLRSSWWLVAAAGAAAILTRQLLIMFGVRYRLTTQRLFVDRGILTIVTDQTELLHVDDVRIRRSLPQRLVGAGDVEVFMGEATDECVTLEAIESPERIAEALRTCVRALRDKKAVFIESI